MAFTPQSVLAEADGIDKFEVDRDCVMPEVKWLVLAGTVGELVAESAPTTSSRDEPSRAKTAVGKMIV
jgi:hypothetical protein